MLPRVSDYMDTVVHTLKPDDEVVSAVRFLLKHQVTGAPVVNDAGEVVGILTEKDCLQLLSSGHQADFPQGKVEDFMTHKVITVSPGMNVYFVAGMFLNNYMRRFPVIDNGKLVGAITRFDILRAIDENLP